MRRLIPYALLVCAAAGLWAQTRDLYLSTAKRKALVIGNDAYVTAPPLRNAVNDARGLGARLRQLGFKVTVVTDAGEEEMDRAVRQFTGSIEPGDVAFFHFSGHGVQIQGDNYLIPVDFAETDEVGARYHSYSATELHDRIASKGAALKILTLDACRNNRFRSSSGGAQGLSAMAIGAEGSYLALATAPGRVADDNPDGENGLFTGALLEALDEEGLELDQVFRKVRAAVSNASGGNQLPWTSSSVTGEFYFVPREGDAPSPPGAVSRPSQQPIQTARLEMPPRRSPVVEAPRSRRAGDIATANLNGVPMEFAWIPPGEFEMGCSTGDGQCDGDEKPQHRVRITKGFEMGRYEVTQSQWEAVMGNNPSNFQGASLPVERVSWEDAQQFLTKLNAKGDGFRYRLPTEAEWEYAARAGSTEKQYGKLDEIGWHGGNSAQETQPVGRKAPNSWGLHDMLGNVLEWRQDWYSGSYYGASPGADPAGPTRGEGRTLRGGSWLGDSRNLRASVRDPLRPSVRHSIFGFRCVREAN